MEINYRKLGLKAGLEIHQQLDTEHKLFCNCSTQMKEKMISKEIVRKMHPVASELGDIDIATQYEYLRDRTFYYQTYPKEVCLVELDCEPPHELNMEALDITIQIALLLNCEIVDEIQVMRKTITDGSNTSGFQRTMVVGLNGYLKYKGSKIPITHVSLEEDAAAIVKEENNNVIYRLSRLGVPLVEIATGILEDYSPKEIQDIAFHIGMICRSTGKVKRGVGSIRQDVNVSIKKGARAEIKGLQELGMLSTIIENEIKRQLDMIDKGERIKDETRSVNIDGTTRFTRPLPGAGRLYPETDIKPISIDKNLIKDIKSRLPEPWTNKMIRFKKKLKLSDDLARQILRSDYLELFEKIIKKKVEPSVVASVFVNIIKELEREGINVKIIGEDKFIEIFDYLSKKKMMKEGIPDILRYMSENPNAKLPDIIKELDLKPINMTELKKIVKDVITQPNMELNKAIGIVMSKVRGRIDPQIVIKIVKKKMK